MVQGHQSFWLGLWRQFKKHRLGMLALIVVAIFAFMAIYAPFLASSKPLVVFYDGNWYFPLFRYLFYRGFYTKRLDIFFNLMIFTTPLFLFCLFVLKNQWRTFSCSFVLLLQLIFFIYYGFGIPKNPSADKNLNRQKAEVIQDRFSKGLPNSPNWDFDLQYMTPYDKLNLLLSERQKKEQNIVFEKYAHNYAEGETKRWIKNIENKNKSNSLSKGLENVKQPIEISTEKQQEIAKMPTLWNMKQEQIKTQGSQDYFQQKQKWIDEQSKNIKFIIMPLLRPFHWEDDAGGGENLNHYVSWWDLTRINRKDLVAALLFGARISLVVGFIAVFIALSIGIPIGALAGFYGGRVDILVYRLIEIWEAMPVFFMLLMVVAILQSKSIFLVISVIGLFSWTGFSRYIRGEFFKQRNLLYVEACRSLGFSDSHIIFSHILPNAIPPLLTLLPFAVMGAITSEAALSFLGLGEEGSASWGVLMDEGRTAFPSQSYLLWPPAILLTTLLVSIAILGDALRDSLDPKLRK